MREFTTAAAEQHEESLGEPITVKIDGHEVTFNGASTGQISMLAAMMAADEMEMMSTVINLFFGLLAEEADRIRFRKRLFKRDDPFGPADVMEIVMGLVEEWTARPTQAPSDSSSQRATSGRKSTVRPR